LRKVAAVATHRRVKDVLLWEDIERLSASRHLSELKAARKDYELVELYEADNKRLEAELKKLRDENEDLQEELAKTQNEVGNWRLTALELQKQSPWMTSANVSEGNERVPLLRVSEAVQRVLEEHGPRIDFRRVQSIRQTKAPTVTPRPCFWL